jgi:hypothetical protein
MDENMLSAPRATLCAIAILLIGAVMPARAQSSNPAPPPELRKWNLWTGDWALTGTAKDGPDGPEYKLDWYLHEHWILGGFFMQVDQTWRGHGTEQHSLEILSYDPARKVHTGSGYSSDGSTWSLTAIFRGETVVENGESRSPDGQVAKCQTTWTFSNHGMALAGTQECEANGIRWKTLDVSGMRSQTAKRRS